MRILHLDAGKEMRGGQWQALRLIEGLTIAYMAAFYTFLKYSKARIMS